MYVLRRDTMNNKQLHAAFFMDEDTDEKIKRKLYNFLDVFDPIELKYSLEPYPVFPKSTKKVIPYSIRNQLVQYENIFQTGTLNKETYDSIIENLMLVYGSEKVVKNDVQIFNATEKTMIGKYLGIPQLEKMFDEDYFQFEWDMHIAQNYREHRNDYQRDHFIHEIRDMYSMMILLGNHGFYQASKKVLLNRFNPSKISQYVQKKLLQFKNKHEDIYFILNNLIQQMKKESNLLPDMDEEEKKKYTDEDTYLEGYFIKYVIYASSILSALFHDMGYPICHFLNLRNRTSEYNPTLYMYTRNETESFDHIASLLSNSLLFTIMSRDEIKTSMNPNKKGLYNHGAYSAIAFLLQFYNSGIIFSLSAEKQCAIELAAVAIYNHTIEFKITDKDDKLKTNFYQPVFNQNPIAFLLRLCDDLQEWGRRYFVVSNESDIPICSSCLTPSIFRFPEDVDRDKILYSCKCSEGKSLSPTDPIPFYNSFRYKNFYNRKLYLVSTSDYMYSHIIDVEGGKKALCFHINYDYYKLLNVARINHTYAKFRLREINNLKELINEQEYKSYFDFDCIFLDYFMTSNPITIKLKILEKFIAYALKKGETRLTQDDIKDVTIDKIISELKFPKKIKYSKSELKTLLEGEGVFDFYKDLLGKVIDLRNNNKGKKYNAATAEVINQAEGFINTYFLNKEFSEYYKQVMRDLLSDTFEQYAKEIIIEKHKTENGFTYTVEDYHHLGKYCSQYAPNDKTENALYNSVQAYCNAENDFNSYLACDSNGTRIPYLNYFSDLYFFEEMNRVVQNEYISEFFEDQPTKQLFQK